MPNGGYRGGNTLVPASEGRDEAHTITPEVGPMEATTPGPLAPEVLERDDVRRALAEHDFSAAFSLIKKWGGLSQNRISELENQPDTLTVQQLLDMANVLGLELRLGERATSKKTEW